LLLHYIVEQEINTHYISRYKRSVGFYK